MMKITINNPVHVKGFLNYKADDLASMNSDEISSLAGSISKMHHEAMFKLDHNQKAEYVSRSHEFGVTVPKTNKSTVVGMAMRLSEKKWWRRKLLRIADERREYLAHISKSLGRDESQQWCTDETVRLMHRRLANIREKMNKSFKIISETIGSKNPIYFSMGDMDRKKRESRMHEVFMDVKALGFIANCRGWKWSFLTLTAPSEYHSNPAQGKCSYDKNLTAKMANEAIAKDWKSIRGYLKERSIIPSENYFGVRVTEVHEDGCPHWHILIFHEDIVLDHIYGAVKAVFVARSGGWYFENFRDQIVVVGRDGDDGEEGVAAASSYIYGYLKFALGCDFSDEPNYSEANKYRCAIKAMGARQYQFFGVGGNKTKLRALARVRGKMDAPEHIKKMAEQMFIKALPEGVDDEHEARRRERQLEARISFYLGDSESLSFEREKYINTYGEEVERIVSIKHVEDAEAVKIGGLCEDISEADLQVLLKELSKV